MVTRFFVWLQTPAILTALKVLLCVMLIVEIYFSLVRVSLPEVPVQDIDKVLHFLMHAANLTIAALAFPAARAYALAAVALFALGPIIEILQSFTPLRSSSWGDQLANTLGFLCAALLAYYWRPVLQARRNFSLKPE